jgi:translation initiation factor IF-3
LCDGNKVKVNIRLKGRQQAHPDVAMRVMKEFCECCKDNCVVEKEPNQEGRIISMILAPSTNTQKQGENKDA